MTFWLRQPWELLKNVKFFPNTSYSLDENLNALTRLSVVITIVMVLLKLKTWPLFLVLSLSVIAFIYFMNTRYKPLEFYQCKQRKKINFVFRRSVK